MASQVRLRMDDGVAAVLGACVGGGLTIAGDVSVRLAFDRRRRKNAFDGVKAEIRDTTADAESRAGEDASGGVAIQPPLSTAAWKAFLAPGYLEQLEPSVAGALRNYYRTVDEANHLSAQATAVIVAAHSAPESDAEALQAEARRLSTEPYARVAAAGASTLELV